MVLGGGGGGWWPVSDGDMMGGQRRSQDAEKLEQSEAVSFVESIFVRISARLSSVRITSVLEAKNVTLPLWMESMRE